MGLDLSSLNLPVLNGGEDQTRRATAKGTRSRWTACSTSTRTSASAS